MNAKIKQGKLKYENKVFQNNKQEKFTVLEYGSSKNVKIKFNKTGTVKTIFLGNMLKGKVFDEQTLKSAITKGLIRENTVGHIYSVVEVKGNSCLVVFKDTKYTRWVKLAEAIRGNIKDRFARDVYGQGFLGEPAQKSYTQKARGIWKEMLRRCYSEKFRPNAKYEKPIVSERWKCFENFLVDLPKIKNFDKWLVEPMHLDKDLMGNSLLYDKSTVCFLTPKENREEQTNRYKRFSANK